MPYRILLADPHHAMRAFVRSMLERAGWEIVDEAADGQEAVLKAVALAPDLVVLDLAMPVRSGLDAAAEILQRSPGTKVVVFTLHEADEIKQEAFRAGVHGYVVKSSSGPDLVSEIRRILEES